MLKKSLSITAAVFLAAGLAACDVEQTQEGSVDLPNYEVTKTDEGHIQVPKAEVTPADVDIKTEEKTVEVPTIETEERKVDVPDVDVTMPKDRQG